VLIILKFGNLKLLEPSVPVKACNGIVLPLMVNTLDNFNSTESVYDLNFSKQSMNKSVIWYKTPCVLGDLYQSFRETRLIYQNCTEEEDRILGGIQNIPDWCRLQYSSCGGTNNLLQNAKL
jgi:hypothetical protein